MLTNYLLKNINDIPDKVFIKNKNEDITYKKFSSYISDRSASLKNFGVVKRDKVAIYLDDPCDILEIFFSCLLIGSIPVILPYKLTTFEINKITSTIDFSLFISSWDKLKNIKIKHVSTIPIQELSHSSSGCSIKSIDADFSIDETQIILFTSGTTGFPKAVQLSAKNIIRSANSWDKEMHFSEINNYLCCIPLYHIGGISIILRSLIHKFTVVIHQNFNTNMILDTVSDFKIDLISLVPTMLQNLIHNDRGIKIAGAFKTIIMSGGPASSKLLDEILHHKLPVYISYGMTETASGICGFWINNYPNKKSSVGLKHQDVKLKINNGLLHIKSPMVMNGYIDDINPNDWFNTNDKAKIDRDGFITIKMNDRGKILSGGINIDTIEIETILKSHPLIKTAKVIGKKDDIWGQKIVAYIESNELDKLQIENLLNEKLSKHKIPKEIIVNNK